MYRSKASVLVLLVALSLRAEQPKVELRNNEVWLIQNGVSRQLTNDGADKIGVVLSHSASKVAYIKQCTHGAGNCSAAIVIIDLAGRSVSSFEPQLSAAGGPCLSILSISWTIDDKAIASECHINPSMSEYVETNLSTGKTQRDLFGYGFMASPDGLKVAHVGPYPHFSWPVAKSNFLMMDEDIIYPLPNGSKPIVSKDFETPEGIVRHIGSKYSGIHEFASSFAWATNSRTIAFIDCVFDWIPKAPGRQIGDEANRTCSLAVVSTSGAFALFPLRGEPHGSAYNPQVKWIRNDQVEVKAASLQMSRVPELLLH